MLNNKWEWYEVWADVSAVDVYLLLVYKLVDGDFVVLDPIENYKVLIQRADYDEIRYWLAEDEYSLVDGRIYDED